MKRAQKNFLGLLGLSVVATMTMVAANIPSPGASATSTLTDTIEVRVVGSVPDVEIIGIKNGAVYTNPERRFQVSYENVETVVVTLTHTDLDGNSNSYVIDELTPDYEYGVEDYTIRLVD